MKTSFATVIMLCFYKKKKQFNKISNRLLANTDIHDRGMSVCLVLKGEIIKEESFH